VHGYLANSGNPVYNDIDNKELRALIMKKNGFTLAEVLITLGIIGVVAALVMPALVNNYRKQALKTGLKKAYSQLSEAAARYQADNGEPLSVDGFFKNGVAEEINALINDFVQSYYKDTVYCKYSFSYISGNGCINATNGFVKDHKRYLDKTRTSTLNTFSNTGQWVLADGSFLMAHLVAQPSGFNYNYEFIMSVDVNGAKPPNTWGKDTFVFQLINGRFVPFGAVGTMYGLPSSPDGIITDATAADADEKYCNANATASKDMALSGQTCTYKALFDENFWRQMKL